MKETTYGSSVLQRHHRKRKRKRNEDEIDDDDNDDDVESMKGRVLLFFLFRVHRDLRKINDDRSDDIERNGLRGWGRYSHNISNCIRSVWWKFILGSCFDRWDLELYRGRVEHGIGRPY